MASKQTLNDDAKRRWSENNNRNLAKRRRVQPSARHLSLKRILVDYLKWEILDEELEIQTDAGPQWVDFYARRPDGSIVVVDLVCGGDRAHSPGKGELESARIKAGALAQQNIPAVFITARTMAGMLRTLFKFVGK